jgi:uncharacterized protein (DUF1800 family)
VTLRSRNGAAMSQDAPAILIALQRFGLGARPGDPARIAGDPRGSVRAQLQARDAALLASDALEPGDRAFRLTRLSEMQRERERSRTAMLGASDMAGGMAASMAPTAPMAFADPKSAAPPDKPTPVPGKPEAKPEPPVEQKLFRAEVSARFERLAHTETGLLERLVAFWSNHFAVSVAKGNSVRVLAGPFEREAIRPHVLGRFADMLHAAESHPAMLFYLDNNQSVGPTSRNGINGKRGLNENLAREILELHTLGVDGGYSQADVTSFARVITGWTVTSPDEDFLYGGRFTFGPARHEPGDHAVLTKVYAEGGVEQGRSVLDDLARHPATARHVAKKLAAHFVADDPPPALVDRLARRFAETEGDLGAVTLALVDSPEAWQTPLAKLRTPQDFVAAALRATGKLPDIGAILGALNALGQPLWQPPGPNGFSDATAAWASPEGMSTRLDLAAQWGRQNGALNPKDLLDAVLGPDVSPETRQAVARAESRQQGLALLFMSPEFQRR